MRWRKSNPVKWQIIGFCSAGSNQKEAAKRFGVTQGEISRLLQKWRESGEVADRRRSGRLRKTTPREDRYILRISRQNHFMSAMQLRNR